MTTQITLPHQGGEQVGIGGEKHPVSHFPTTTPIGVGGWGGEGLAGRTKVGKWWGRSKHMEQMKQKKRPKRPTRQRKSDRLTHSGISQEEMMCDYALGPFDRTASDMDKKWGVDVLPELVPPEMAARYGSAMAKLNAAIEAQDPAEVTKRAAVCIRGMHAMDQAAAQSGATPASQDVWLVQADGREFGLLRDARAWPAVQKKHPNVTLISEREMILAIEMYQKSLAGKLINQVKDSFPDADMIKIGNNNLEDDIPW